MIRYLPFFFSRIPLINKPPGGSDGQEVTPTPAIDATYWLTMSSKVRPGIPFQISAQLLRGQNPVEVTVTFMDQEGVEILLEPPPFTITPGGESLKQLFVGLFVGLLSVVYEPALKLGISPSRLQVGLKSTYSKPETRPWCNAIAVSTATNAINCPLGKG